MEIMATDRRMLRFLWFVDIKEKELKIRRLQFRRLVFGLTPSPAIFVTIIHRHLFLYQERKPEIVFLLNDLFHVDDLSGGTQNDDDALNVHERAQTFMKEGGFTLTKWTSNWKTFRGRVASKEKEEDSHLLKKSNDLTNCKSDETIYVSKIYQTPKNPRLNLTDTLEDNNVKILGLNWNVEIDKFHF